MKELLPAIVLVKDIQPSVPRNYFAEDRLDQAAQLILEIEGVINPLILRRTGVQSYQIIEGDFEYYAALRAKEIDLRRGESINVYIVEELEQESVFKKQIQLFRQQKPMNTKSSPKPHQLDTVTQALSKIVDSVGEVAKKAVQDINRISSQALEDISHEVDTLKSTLSENTLLESSTQPKSDNSTTKEAEHSPSQGQIATTSETQEGRLLQAINTLDDRELSIKLNRAKVKKDVISNILAERNKKPFASDKEIIKRVKGLGPGTFKTIKEILE